MKKIMILGGSSNQLPLVLTSKNLGYYTIVCDSRMDAPATKYGNKHLLINTADYESILEAARLHKIDGIITNSEPVVPIMTNVANELGLKSNPVEGINTLMSKYSFRKLQKDLSIYSPKHFVISDIGELDCAAKSLQYPIIIKPCECSGSRGTTLVDSYDMDLMLQAYTICKDLSRNQKVSIEEYIEMDGMTTIEGEVFINGDDIIWDGMFNTTRSDYAPMVPMTYTIPWKISVEDKEKVKAELTKIFKATGIVFGEFNVEGFFTKEHEFFIVEINVRQGGHELPLFVKNNTNIDMTKLLVSLSVGDEKYWNETINKTHRINEGVRHVIFAHEDGKFRDISISHELSNFVKSINIQVKKGDIIKKCTTGSDLIGYVDFGFPDADTCKKYYYHMEDFVKVLFL